MTMQVEIKLRDFEFWGGAKQYTDKLTPDELDSIEEALDLTPIFLDPPTMTDINDFIWFNTEIWPEWIGTTEDEILARG